MKIGKYKVINKDGVFCFNHNLDSLELTVHEDILESMIDHMTSIYNVSAMAAVEAFEEIKSE